MVSPLPHIAQRWARRGGVFRQSAGIRGKKSCNILYNPTLRNAPGFGKMDTSTSTSYFWAGGRLCPIGHGVPAHCDAAVCLCLCHFCVKAGGIRLYGRVRVLNPDGRAQRRRPATVNGGRKMPRAKQSMDGNTAAAHVAYAFTDVAAIYPHHPLQPPWPTPLTSGAPRA